MKKTKIEGVNCNQEFRNLIGYKVIEVVSDQLDMNGSIILENEETGDKKVLMIDDVMYDGQHIYILSCDAIDQANIETIELKAFEVDADGLAVLDGLRVYCTGTVQNEENETVASSITYVKGNGDKPESFRSLYIYKDGKIRMTEEY